MFADLSHGELLAIVNAAHRCVGARSHADLAAILGDVAALASSPKTALCTVAMGHGKPSLLDYINHSFGAWGDLYAQRRYVLVDPVIRHAFAVTGAFTWREAIEQHAGPAAAEFLRKAQEFALRDGVSYACESPPAPSARTVLTLAVEGSGRCDHAKAIVAALGPHVHDAYTRMRGAHVTPAGNDDLHDPLSDREREVLSWAKQGKTSWEIGCILGISERTVKFHFMRIKWKLDVVSRCHAVAKAMNMGLIA